MPVATANGKKFTFPDGTTPEQMGEAIDEYFSTQEAAPAQQKEPEQSMWQRIEGAAMKVPGVPALAEFSAAANKAVFDMADFVGPGAVNAALNVAGSDKRMPTIAGTLGSEGGYMEPGLARDAVQAAGKTVPLALGTGQAFRMGAEKLPAMVSGGESVARGALRQMGTSTAAQDIGYGAVAGAGSVVGGEVGERVGGESGRVVGETLGGIAAPAIVAGAKPAAESMVKAAARGGEQGRQKLAKAVADFAEFGRAPTLGQGTGDGFRQGMENLSSRVLGGGPIRRALDETGDAMQKRLVQISDDLSGVRGQVETGRVIQKGITGDDGFIQRFKAKNGQLWGALDDKISTDAQVKAANTEQALNVLVRDDSLGKILNNPKLSGLKTAIEKTTGPITTQRPVSNVSLSPGEQTFSTGTTGVDKALVTRNLADAKITGAGNAPGPLINYATGKPITKDTIAYGDLKALRTQIGEMLGSRELVSDVPRNQLKRVYAALSEDVKEAARIAGALPQFNRAKTYTRAGHQRIDDFVERVANKVDLDKIYQAVASGGEGTQSLNAIKRSLKPDEWEAVVSNVVRNMGKATPGQQDNTEEMFSAAKFITDWNKLGPSKKVLFSGSDKLNRYSENMDRIASAASMIKEGAKTMANPSGTAQSMTNMSLLGGAFGTALAQQWGPFSLILGGVALNNGSARLMTNQRFVSWLANGTKIQDWPRHIGVLSQIAKSEGLEQEIGELIEALREGGQDTKTPQAPEPQRAQSAQ